MSITMDELTDVPVDGRIVVSGQPGESQVEYVRTADGFCRTGGTTTIEPGFFSGAVAADRVTVITPTVTTTQEEPVEQQAVRAGDLFGQTVQYLVLTAPDDQTGRVDYMSVNEATGLWRGNFSRTEVRTLLSLHRSVEQNPPWKAQLLGLGSHVLAARAQARTAEQALAQATTPAPVQEVPDRLRAALLAVIDEFDDADDKARLRQVLNENGIPATVEHATEVIITGTSNVLIGNHEIHGFLGDDFEDNDTGRVEVSWRRVVTVYKQGFGDCTCSEVDSDDLEEFVPNNTDGWDWETECAD